MKDYGDLLSGEQQEDAARKWSARVRDVSEFLDALGLLEPPALREPMTVAYHDACHLAHAQGIRTAPRALLARVANLRVIEIPDGEICCGSAGLYNVEHPTVAHTLGAQKAQAILSTGAQAVAAGNIGCLVQIATHLAAGRGVAPGVPYDPGPGSGVQRAQSATVRYLRAEAVRDGPREASN